MIPSLYLDTTSNGRPISGRYTLSPMDFENMSREENMERLRAELENTTHIKTRLETAVREVRIILPSLPLLTTITTYYSSEYGSINLSIYLLYLVNENPISLLSVLSIRSILSILLQLQLDNTRLADQYNEKEDEVERLETQIRGIQKVIHIILM